MWYMPFTTFGQETEQALFLQPREPALGVEVSLTCCREFDQLDRNVCSLSHQVQGQNSSND